MVACPGCILAWGEPCFWPLTGGTGSSTPVWNSTRLSCMTRCLINIAQRNQIYESRQPWNQFCVKFSGTFGAAVDDSASSTWGYNMSAQHYKSWFSRSDNFGSCYCSIKVWHRNHMWITGSKPVLSSVIWVITSYLLPLWTIWIHFSLQPHVITMRRGDGSLCHTPNYVYCCKERKKGICFRFVQHEILYKTFRCEHNLIFVLFEIKIVIVFQLSA